VWRQLRKNRLSLVGSAIVLSLVVVALTAPFLGLPSPFFIFAAFGLLVLVTLKLRLPDDTPQYAVRGRLVRLGPAVSEARDEYAEAIAHWRHWAGDE
jgi:hypothetical protein